MDLSAQGPKWKDAKVLGLCSSPGHLEFFYSERGFPDASGSGMCSSKHYAMVQWQVVAFRAEK
jgi:hypothetical protein